MSIKKIIKLKTNPAMDKIAGVNPTFTLIAFLGFISIKKYNITKGCDNLNERLEKLRKDLGLSQKDF